MFSVCLFVSLLVCLFVSLFVCLYACFACYNCIIYIFNVCANVDVQKYQEAYLCVQSVMQGTVYKS